MLPVTEIDGIIPARMGSTRLPGKALRPIAGTPMIERVYRGARECRKLRQVWVATDAEEIAAFCRGRGIPAQMTAATHRSGTDRVLEAAERLGSQAVVNIQGDEPMVRAEMLDLLIAALFARPEIEVATLRTPLRPEAAGEPGTVKVVCDGEGRALYFSRAVIPYARDAKAAPRLWKHLGYYAYSLAALRRFTQWPAGELEQCEQLEQLRFLENGTAIAAAATEHDTIGVDTLEDWQRAEARLTGIKPE